MSSVCVVCESKVSRGKVYCSKQCSDINKLQNKIEEVAVLKKELKNLKRRIEAQNILWENMVCDIVEGSDSSATIRWWKNKLINEHHVSSQSRMINWLTEVAAIVDTYNEVRKIS